MSVFNPEANTCFFGRYEQYNNTFNDKEEIEWLVVDKQENKALLISKYGLIAKEYNEYDESVTWETCTLRKWLNNDFINEAFNKEQQALIQTTYVTADKNPEYDTDPGNATNDKVFLLSIPEAEKYFTNDEDRRCIPTAYAREQGVYTVYGYENGNKPTCWWWLRSPGDLQDSASYVLYDGSVHFLDISVSNYGIAVRPALWISLG